MTTTRTTSDATASAETSLSTPPAHSGLTLASPVETEKVKYSVCKDCGATYSAGSAAKRMHQHRDFRTVTIVREKLPLEISYLKSVDAPTDKDSK